MRRTLSYLVPLAAYALVGVGIGLDLGTDLGAALATVGGLLWCDFMIGANRKGKPG